MDFLRAHLVMPLAMATRLQSSLLIITTALGSQPIYVTPKDGAMEGTIILVYEPIGSGHYDAALPYCDTLSQVSMSSNVSKCVSLQINKKILESLLTWCTLCHLMSKWCACTTAKSRQENKTSSFVPSRHSKKQKVCSRERRDSIHWYLVRV